MPRKPLRLPVPEQHSRARPAPWGPTASRQEVGAYLRERMVLLSKLMFWIFWILVAFVLALYEIYPETRPANTAVVHYVAFGGLFFLGVVWYFALHARASSIEALYRIDIVYAMMVGAAFGVSAYFTSDRIPNIYSAFIWHTFMVFTRVIIVPSTGTRTAWLTSASYIPLVMASTGVAINFPARSGLPPTATIIGTLLFAAVAVLLATTGSRVIYGLRRQVREAVQLGQYTLDEKIGEGGMGSVYKAHHSMLRRPTAIKLLPLDKHDSAGKSASESAARFEREVQHTSQLTHPNTVAIFDYGRSPNGLFYYAMEYLDGIDLERLVQRFGRQPASRVIHILTQVCGSLGEAHANGLTHRDIKPGNILLCQRGRKPDVVKVVDFGLVADVASPGVDGSRSVQGTPAYLCPEAVTDPDAIGARSDLYSLGAVAYFLLTGQRVFEGDTAVELCVAHASKKPTPPSERIDGELPAELEALVMQCLAKSPSARPGSADELAATLETLPNPGDWSDEDARAWWVHFDETRAARGQRDPRTPLSVTMTVDLRDRALDTTTDLPLASDQDRVTGQATK